MFIVIFIALFATVAIQGPGDYQITKPERVDQVGPQKW